MTIQVRHEPRKQVIIHEISQYATAEELAKLLTVGLPFGALPPLLRWVNGVVLSFTSLPAVGDMVAQEIIEGRLHWDHVAFAPMPTYQPQIALPERGITLDIVNVSANETFSAIGSFLRSKLSDKPKRKQK